MATSSLISIKTKEGLIKTIYCHYDGYIDYVGKILKNYYTSYENVLKLIENGNIASLGIDPTPLKDGEENKRIETETYRFWVHPSYYNEEYRTDTFKEWNKLCQRSGVGYIYIFAPDKNGNYRWLFKREIQTKKDYGACYETFYHMSGLKELTDKVINRIEDTNYFNAYFDENRKGNKDVCNKMYELFLTKYSPKQLDRILFSRNNYYRDYNGTISYLIQLSN